MADFEKPLCLPLEIVAVLRGQMGYTENCAPLAELAIYAYRDGKAGKEYIPVEEDPGFSAWTAKCLDRFLRAAHKQGRVDAGLDHAAPLHSVVLKSQQE